MTNEVFEFSLGETKYEVGRLKGRAARKNMFKIIGLFSQLINEAQANGFSLESLFAKIGSDDELEVSIFFDEIVKVIVAVGPLMKDETFLDEFESTLPIILGAPDDVLEKEGDFVEVYTAAIQAMMFHIGQNMTPEASESLQNFTEQSGQSEPETPVEIVKLEEEA